jgi:transposase
MSKSEKKTLQIRQRRTFSEEFKRQKVQLIVDKTTTIADVAELYGVCKMTVYRWLYRYSPHHQQGTNQVVQMESEEHKNKQLLQKLADTERMVGQQAIQLAYLERLIAIAGESLKIDLKKNFSTPPLNGSATTQAKTSTQ